MRMKAADTSASSAIADWTPLTVVSRSSTTAEIDTFISDVSTTSTNMAIASRIASRGVDVVCSGMLVSPAGLRPPESLQGELVRRGPAVGAHPGMQAAIREVGDLDRPCQVPGAAGGAGDELDMGEVDLRRARVGRACEQAQRTQLVLVQAAREELVLGHGRRLERLMQPGHRAGFGGRPCGDTRDVAQERRAALLPVGRVDAPGDRTGTV